MQLEKASYRFALASWPSCRAFLRDLTVAGALGVSLLAVQSYAQANRVALAASHVSSALAANPSPAATDEAIRPFHVSFPQAKLDDLRRRVAATKWPAQETVPDASQGVQLATIRKLANYWEKEYDWRKCEAKLNALPQFMTTIDGLDIHLIHVRSKNPDALPLIVT